MKRSIILPVLIGLSGISSLFGANVTAASGVTVYEAEKAVLSGVETVTDSAYSGGKYVRMEGKGSCTFKVTVPAKGYYDLTFTSAGLGGDKVNTVSVDGETAGDLTSSGNKLTSSTVSGVYMGKGTHEVAVTPSWGWICLDRLEVKEADGVDASLYKVSSQLSDKNATERTKRLMKYLCDNYGKNVLSGQQCEGMDSPEYRAIKAATGKAPAIMGLDLMNYSGSRVARGSSGKSIEQALEFDSAGGIVTMCWHWCAPSKFIKKGNDSKGNPNWWGAFYTDNVEGLKLSKIMADPSSEDYRLLVEDIDRIAEQLKRLQDKDVPVLFRPLHEASGGWFWWGADGAEPYKKLWKLIYTRLTDYHGIHNLIWVWNAQSPEWYPGDGYVDIIGEDIYPGAHQYSPQGSRFITAASAAGTRKIVTLSENGCLFDIDRAKEQGIMWSWFCVWGGEFAVKGSSISTAFTDKKMWEKVYNHKNVITLDEVKY
ncbi:MAG: beta-mannosidase [Oscillospiraceae bacterium]|nr:beta-mannosidase [Oscillospiraceae bacterium]